MCFRALKLDKWSVNERHLCLICVVIEKKQIKFVEENRNWKSSVQMMCCTSSLWQIFDPGLIKPPHFIAASRRVHTPLCQHPTVKASVWLKSWLWLQSTATWFISTQVIIMWPHQYVPGSVQRFVSHTFGLISESSLRKVVYGWDGGGHPTSAGWDYILDLGNMVSFVCLWLWLDVMFW